MSAYVKAADAIREAFDCAVVIVHHCGIDGTRPRGHTSLTGAADAQLSVKRDALKNIIVSVEWMKDGDSEGDMIASRLEQVEVGVDEDGEPITSCIVISVEPEPADVTAKRQRLNPNQQTMLNLLDAAGSAGLSLDEWNDKARDLDIGAKRRATLFDIRSKLEELKLVHSYADRWYSSRLR